ncbi:MAG: Branched-chain phosphotransacylase [Candidatus Kapaibacterium sp.]|jgi:phosphate butyryltransferase|nr:MAG: Branched-chain phosphotransacylase [Candidatus Kapabacteria bacterium]ROL58237.1 MAG: phosphate butyryltransferase [Bacteroidetes/Chlorobi group bacterium Naka2016]
MELNKLENLVEIALSKPKKKIAVAASEDEQVLLALKQATDIGIVEPILVGNLSKTKDLANQIGFDIEKYEFIEESNPAKSARIAVQMVREGKAQIIMKGLVNTADYLRAILDKEIGLRTGNLLSHIGVFEIPAYHKLIGLTDAAQNIAPNLEEKVSIVQNSVDLLRRLGIENPKVALLAAVENVNPKMQATIDAALITMMNRRGQIKNCIIDGPLAFDNAVSKEAAEHKGIVSPVAGDADLLVAPEIETGNALYKSFTYFAGGVVAAIILGAMVPIVLTSRADTEKSKLMSIALAASF